MNNEYLEDAAEAIRTNGHCPSHMTCDKCWFKAVNGTVAGCNPCNAVTVARAYLDKMGYKY